MNDTAVVTGFLHKGHNHRNCRDEALNRADAVCKARSVPGMCVLIDRKRLRGVGGQ